MKKQYSTKTKIEGLRRLGEVTHCRFPKLTQVVFG